MRDNPPPLDQAEAPGTRPGQGPEDRFQNLSPFSGSIKTEHGSAPGHPASKQEPPEKTRSSFVPPSRQHLTSATERLVSPPCPLPGAPRSTELGTRGSQTRPGNKHRHRFHKRNPGLMEEQRAESPAKSRREVETHTYKPRPQKPQVNRQPLHPETWRQSQPNKHRDIWAPRKQGGRVKALEPPAHRPIPKASPAVVASCPSPPTS